jgi:hypothetical protein
MFDISWKFSKVFCLRLEHADVCPDQVKLKFLIFRVLNAQGV